MIATTIEQSKHLLSLGLDTKTADMALCNGVDGKLYPVPRELQEQAGFPLANDDLAWSLSALLEVIRKVKAISYVLLDAKIMLRCKDMGFIWEKDIYADDLITAAYEMVYYLLEQGLIKKGDSDEQ
jgi:hypothetical protein